MTLLQDVRFSARMLVKQPGFTLVMVVALALGIGANATVFTLVNAVLFRPLPFRDGERIMYLSSNDRPRNRENIGLSYPDLQDWRAQTKAFQSIGGFSNYTVVLTDESNAPERYQGTRVSANLFGLLGQQPALGRDFMAGEDRPGAPAVCMIGYTIWETRYGRNASIIGKTIRINDVPATIVGIMPKGMKFPTNTDLWTPLSPTPETEKRESRGINGVGRLADG